MIYEIGTISTKANDPKITGKNTLWKNSVTKVSVGQIILIQSGNTIYQNSIRSVESDTQMTLSFPVPVVLTDVKYVISITMIGSVSDGVNKATAMVTESYQLMMILNRLMTESGVIKVVLPDGTEMQLRTEKERDRLLDGKFNKAGGTVNGLITATGVITAGGTVQAKNPSIECYVQMNAGSDYVTLNTKRPNTPWRTHALPDASGTLMQVGDYGWGGTSGATSALDTEQKVLDFIKNEAKTQILRNDSVATRIATRYSPIAIFKTGDTFFTLSANFDGTRATISSGLLSRDQSLWPVMELYHNRNTTKDSNGNLKAASPIIKVFADHIETNDESEGVTLEKLGTGRYKLKGTLGMHSDASWGGIHGGLVVPNGINNLPLVWADFDVLPDGDIVIETRYRKHTLHQMLEAQRLMTYPEFLDENNEEREDYDYCDIPNGHWIDVRVNMPSNSIYNQKQAEAERLAKLEAERLAQEEAKRAAEEAERAEQEAAEREQYGLGENDVLL
ncbi:MULTISPECIES: phage tail fiber protein [Providencia]|uniref:Phage tail protein C-terminal domain-containing protein n=2 Tax=Providencia rettgeri TaxID=587 RepID=A0A379FQR0_PRORE|nr:MULTISPECIES: hypothetical protein [Providencia]MBG5900238.1 hypothetical protein [Providencia rettgeri]MBS0857820.1 hypothetical protein [Providencia rettgeri]MBS0871559.1 hypothetical protein [Providencia rettgeri]MBS0918706.1 hypothetical protein [Providencia rettgeri]SUC31089.1 Uncharacterised protein [Providencia rettgeri]